jgi:hypothetical protein
MTDEQFMRRWWLYLNGAQAAFATGCCHLWQIVIARDKTVSLPLTRAPWLIANETGLTSARRLPNDYARRKPSTPRSRPPTILASSAETRRNIQDKHGTRI